MSGMFNVLASNSESENESGNESGNSASASRNSAPASRTNRRGTSASASRTYRTGNSARASRTNRRGTSASASRTNRRGTSASASKYLVPPLSVTQPRLMRQHSNEVYNQDRNFFLNLTKDLIPNQPFFKENIIFFLNRAGNNLIIKPVLGFKNEATNYSIPHISIHAPSDRVRANKNNLYNTKFHFVIGLPTSRRIKDKLYLSFPMDLRLLCDNKISFNEITKKP